MDSIQKGMDGIFIGRVKFPGHFDECVRAVNDEFTGKYCTLHLILNLALGHTIKPVIQFWFIKIFGTINFSCILPNYDF